MSDLPADNAVHAAFVRSTHANAVIRDVQVASAQAMPGVILVITGKELRDSGLGLLPCFWHVTNSDGSPMKAALAAPLSADRVRYVGEPVAVVIAEKQVQALDAAEQVEIEYEMLNCVTATSAALFATAPVIHEELGSNVAFEVRHGQQSEVDQILGTAPHITELVIVNNRVSPSPLEPRSIIAQYDPGTENFTLWTPSQNPHVLRNVIAEHTLRVPEHRLRVISPDVGGAFGQRSYHFAEEAVLLWASRLLGRSVRWTSTRSELLAADPHARDHVTRAQLAIDVEGRFLGLKVHTVAGVGAYLGAYGAGVAAYKYPRGLCGLYNIPAVSCAVVGVYTNTAPIDAYRGAGHPEATLVIERLVDTAARELGVDPLELRERNLVHRGQFPITTPLGFTYDSGNFEGLIDATKHAYKLLRDEQERLRAKGQLMGIGVAGFIDTSGGMPTKVARKAGRIAASFEVATVRVHPTGKITLFCGSHAHGQGHATTFAQIVADRLGCDIDSIELCQGDTDSVPFGQGTYGSRSTIVAGTALVAATARIVQKGKVLAAHLLECGQEDISFANGSYQVTGTDRRISFPEIANAAYRGVSYPDGFELGLETTVFSDPTGLSTQSGLHICAILVDRDTGQVRVRDYICIDDFGKVINPMIVEGQVHGAIAQGIGQALMENCFYDKDSGQLLSGSFMDYALPRASDMPDFQLNLQETPASTNPLGAKGAGESGTVGALAAIANGVVDALAHLGVTHVDLPLTPMRVWKAIHEQKSD